MRFSLAVHRGHVAWWLLTALRPPEQAPQVALTFEADLWPLSLVFCKPARSRCCAVYHVPARRITPASEFLDRSPLPLRYNVLANPKRSGFRQSVGIG